MRVVVRLRRPQRWIGGRFRRGHRAQPRRQRDPCGGGLRCGTGGSRFGFPWPLETLDLAGGGLDFLHCEAGFAETFVDQVVPCMLAHILAVAGFAAADNQAVRRPRHRHVKQAAIFVLGFRDHGRAGIHDIGGSSAFLPAQTMTPAAVRGRCRAACGSG